MDTQYNLSECNSIFAYIPQEVFIFDDSIATNIAIGVEKNHIDIILINVQHPESNILEFISSIKNENMELKNIPWLIFSKSKLNIASKVIDFYS